MSRHATREIWRAGKQPPEPPVDYDFFAEPDTHFVCRNIRSNFDISAFASSFLRRASSERCFSLGTDFLRAVRPARTLSAALPSSSVVILLLLPILTGRSPHPFLTLGAGVTPARTRSESR